MGIELFLTIPCLTCSKAIDLQLWFVLGGLAKAQAQQAKNIVVRFRQISVDFFPASTDRLFERVGRKQPLPCVMRC